LIKGNTLSNNPRGIILWSTAVRDVAIANNTLTENSGILVRAFQKTSQNRFAPILNVSLLDNKITNNNRRYSSYLSIHFANNDGQAFGTSHFGVEVRRNTINANSPNIDDSRYSGPFGKEGFMNQMNVETSAYATTTMPRLLGTIMQANSCNRCATAFRLGTGAAGTVISGSKLQDSGALWSNLPTSSSTELAVGTLVE